MTVSSSMPWGISRMAPFPDRGGTALYRVALDPVTQMGVYTDPVTNQPIEAAKHGSNVQQSTATQPPTPDGDGGNNGIGKPDSTTDWVPD